MTRTEKGCHQDDEQESHANYQYPGISYGYSPGKARSNAHFSVVIQGRFLDTDRFCVFAIKKKSVLEMPVIFVISLLCLNAACISGKVLISLMGIRERRFPSSSFFLYVFPFSFSIFKLMRCPSRGPDLHPQTPTMAV